MGIRCADHVTPLYPQNLALTSPTGGGRSVGIVRSRTKATEFSLVYLFQRRIGYDQQIAHGRHVHNRCLTTQLFINVTFVFMMLQYRCFPFFVLLSLILTCFYTHCSCRRLLLHPITLSDTYIHGRTPLDE